MTGATVTRVKAALDAKRGAVPPAKARSLTYAYVGEMTLSLRLFPLNVPEWLDIKWDALPMRDARTVRYQRPTGTVSIAHTGL